MSSKDWAKKNLSDEEKIEFIKETTDDLFESGDDSVKFVQLAVYEEEAKDLIANWGKKQGFLSGIKSYDDLTYGMVKGELIVIAGTPGVGKAQTLETAILTPNGFRELGDIQAGGYVYGQDGRPKKVIATKEWQNRPVYKVEFSDGTISYCDINHLWKVETRKQRGKNTDGKNRHKILSTKQLLEDGYIDTWGGGNRSKYFVPIPQSIQHTKKQLPIDPYLLGCLLANGSLTGSTIDITTNDTEVVDRCKLPDNVYVKERTYESSTARHWVLRTKNGQPNPLTRAIKTLGINKLSHDKFIPEDYLLGSIEQRRELLAGLLDCDGSVRSDGNRGQALYFSASPDLAHGVRELVHSLGGVTKLCKYERENAKNPEYVVSIMIENNPFTLSRKAELFRPTRPSKSIRSIKYDGKSTTKCLEVEGSLYISDFYTVTHNSALIANLAVNLASEGTLVGIVNLEIRNGHLAGRVGKAHGGDWSALPIVVQEQHEEQEITTKNILPAVKELADGGCEIVIIDYLQMLALASDEEYKEVSKTVRALKSMAVSNNIVVIAISSLNRSRDDKELTMKSLHGSGKIEFFADIILFLERQEGLQLKIVKNRNRKYDYQDDFRPLDFDGAKMSSPSEYKLPDFNKPPGEQFS